MEANINFKNEIKRINHELINQTPPWAEYTLHSLFETSNILEIYINRLYNEYGITHTGIAILNHLIQHNGKLHQKRFSKYISRSKQAVTSVLANLENHGMIVREVGGKDRRKRIVCITEKGVNLVKECLYMREKFYSIFTTIISQNESEQLVNTLTKINLKFSVMNNRHK